jgi:hypothetical protein
MEESEDILDMGDPYDAHAYFMLSFICSRCETALDADEAMSGRDDMSCRRLADKAKASGWFVPPPEGPERRMSLETCYCPSCATKRGLRTSGAPLP